MLYTRAIKDAQYVRQRLEDKDKSLKVCFIYEPQIFTMTILVTGGTGKTGSVLSRLLSEANHSVLIASRSGTAPSPYKAVKFDWFDDKTFENPFKEDSNIDRVYLIVPAVLDQLNIVRPFIDLAISKGVKRFVLLSGSQLESGSPALAGKVHEYLVNIKVDYAVLRPTWFIRMSFLNVNSRIKDKRLTNRLQKILVLWVTRASANRTKFLAWQKMDVYLLSPLKTLLRLPTML